MPTENKTFHHLLHGWLYTRQSVISTFYSNLRPTEYTFILKSKQYIYGRTIASFYSILFYCKAYRGSLWRPTTFSASDGTPNFGQNKLTSVPQACFWWIWKCNWLVSNWQCPNSRIFVWYFFINRLSQTFRIAWTSLQKTTYIHR